MVSTDRAVPLLLMMLLTSLPSSGQPRPAPAVHPATRGATAPASRPTTSTIVIGSAIKPPEGAMPREALDLIYRRELGPLYKAADAEALYKSHCLIERYFTTEYAEDRKALVKWLGDLAIEPNILGRITRIHMVWPALEAGTYYVNERVGPHDVAYFLGVPKGYDRSTPSPLVMMLPTATAFLTKPPPDADAVTRIYTDWMGEELARHPDALVVMPLLNLKEVWGPSYAGMWSVIGSLQHATSRVNVEPARVYMTGHSMSAHATWNLALHYPTYFAAINPMAGAASADWQRIRLLNLRNVLPVVWHDADDLTVAVKHARELVAIFRKYKYDCDYEETKGIGHTPTSDIVLRLYDKMRARTRELYPHEACIQSNRPETLFNRSDWVQMYQALTPGKDQRVLFRIGTGHMIVSANSMSLQAAFTAPNRIEAKTANLEAMRFYVNDQMINFSKPVTVLINGKVRFEGIVKPNIDEMLKDQLLLGRGWRYYTAVVDTDFGEPSIKPATKPVVPPRPVPPAR